MEPDPDEIYAEYKGKIYKFEFGRRHFRSVMGVDSIAVSLDSMSGRAVLPTSGRIRKLTFSFVLIAGIGVLLIWISIMEGIKRARNPRETVKKG